MFWGGFMGVSTYNHNNNSGDKNCQNRDALYHALMAVLLMSNGVTVGGALNLYLGGRKYSVCQDVPW